jgi:quercetin dioxygenase-like cupin family protein
MTIRTPSKAALLKSESLPRYERGCGVSTTPLVTRAVGATGFITGYTSFGGGAEIPFHSHNCEESVVLMKGRAILDVDGLEYELKPHDVTYIPPGISHRFRNASKTEPMKILWIYANADATRTITATGVTNPVSAEHGNKH